MSENVVGVHCNQTTIQVIKQQTETKCLEIINIITEITKAGQRKDTMEVKDSCKCICSGTQMI